MLVVSNFNTGCTVLKNCLWIVQSRYWGEDSNFVAVSWTFGGELKTNLVNLFSNYASEAGVMAQCPYGRHFQLIVFSCFFQIQFLKQQLCAKILRKQEKNPSAYAQTFPLRSLHSLLSWGDSFSCDNLICHVHCKQHSESNKTRQNYKQTRYNKKRNSEFIDTG